MRSATPKYERIAADIRQRIEMGDLQPGDRLPTVVQLCAYYQVSKITVRHALEVLSNEGLVMTLRGSGSYVHRSVGQAPDGITTNLSTGPDQGFTEINHGANVTSDVYAFEQLSPPEDILSNLDLAPGAMAYYVERVRKVDGVPVAVEYSYMPVALVPGLKRQHLEGSVFAYIRQDLGLEIASTSSIVRAVQPLPDEVGRLDVHPDAPLLELEHVHYLKDGTPLDYVLSHNVGSRFEIRYTR